MDQASLPKKFYVQLGLVLLSFAAFCILVMQTLNLLRVNGPIYQEIVQGKDLIADILPPPEYIIESYLSVMQLTGETNAEKIKEITTTLHRLKKEYQERHEYWEKELPVGLPSRALLLQASYKPATEFFRIVEEDFIPTIEKGDRKQALTIAHGSLKKTYLEHRAAIDSIVQLTREDCRRVEAGAEQEIRERTRIMIGVAGPLLIFIVVCCAILYGKHVTKKIQENAALMKVAKENAEASDRLKSEFLAVMSHEIRTPMNGVIGFTNLLAETPLNEDQKDYVQTVSTCAHSLLSLLNDILDFSKLEAQRVQLESLPIPLGKLAENVLDLHAYKASETNVELISEVSERLPESFLGDETRLKQVLSNLIANAVKFTASGEILLRILPATSDVGKIRFEVRDTGIGISPEVIPTLFKAFVQADSSTTRQFGGTGLGLAICKRLVELMQGKIGIESVLGKGTTIWFEIPLVAAATIPQALLSENDSGSFHGLRVLIVDDNETNRRLLLKFLVQLDFEVSEASSGATALEMIRKMAPFDLMILDLMMPEMDGIALAQEIKKSESLVVPKILLSSVGRGDLSAEQWKPYFEASIHKPLHYSILRSTLIKLLKQKAELPAAVLPVAQKREGARRAILVAEDNLTNQKLLGKLIEHEGCDFDLVEDGEAAIQAFQRKPYDLILMDIQMPVMGGLEATRQIRALESAEKRAPTPIIAVTANAMAEDCKKCLDHGMTDYVAKPLKVDDISRVISKYCS